MNTLKIRSIDAIEQIESSDRCQPTVNKDSSVLLLTKQLKTKARDIWNTYRRNIAWPRPKQECWEYYLITLRNLSEIVNSSWEHTNSVCYLNLLQPYTITPKWDNSRISKPSNLNRCGTLKPMPRYSNHSYSMW